MFNLVWKDFLILKRFLWFTVLYGFLGLFAFSFSMKSAALSVTSTGVMYILIDQACAQDTKNKSEIILNSLPLRRRDIVLAKYLSAFPYAALAILSFVFAHGVVSVTGIPVLGVPSPISKISLEEITSALVAMVALVSIYYPIYFRLGYTKWAGMTLFFIFTFIIPISGPLIVRGLRGVHNPFLRNMIALMGRIENWLQTQAGWQITSYMLGLALILIATSVRLSLRFYSKREF